MDNNEEILVEKIKQAQKDGNFEQIKELMKQLISMQKDLPANQLTDDELARKGVDMLLLDQERKLSEEIKEHNQKGEFGEANAKMRELVRIQKLQPTYVGIKLRE